MVGVDVCRLDVDEALGVLSRRTETFTQQLRHNFHELRMQPRETLQFLYPTHQPFIPIHEQSLQLTALVQL